MKILQIIDSLNIGGAERMAVNMANTFSESDISNVLVCSRYGGQLINFLSKETSYYDLEKRNFADIMAFYKLTKIVKKESPDVIHAHSTSLYWAILIKMLFPSVKLLWHDHYGNSESLKDNDRKLIQFFSSHIDGVVAVNEILFHWANRNLKTKNNVFIRNFPLLGKLLNNVVKEKIIILHLANLRPQKDHLTLIEAVRILKQKTNIPFHVWCVGNDLNDVYSLSLKIAIEKYSIDKEIEIMGAVLDTQSLFEQASIGILCSESEGLPVSLLEYGLAGLPVVVTDVGQCAEVVGKGVFGKVVEPKRPESLAHALLTFIENPNEAKQMGLEFKKHINSEYGAHKFLNKYSQLIGSLK